MRIYLVKKNENGEQFLVKAQNQADALAAITKQSYEITPVKPVELHTMLSMGFKVLG